MHTGNRITLTYNLYISEHVGGVLQQFPTADPELYPLFEGAKQMLEGPGFMKKGMLHFLRTSIIPRGLGNLAIVTEINLVTEKSHI